MNAQTTDHTCVTLQFSADRFQNTTTQDVDVAQLDASALGVSVDHVSSFSHAKASWEVKLVVFHSLLIRYSDDERHKIKRIWISVTYLLFFD